MSSIQGKVINQQDGQGIVGANVRANDGTVNREVPTGQGGAFVIDSLNAGKYELFVNKSGFQEGIFGPIAVLDGFPTDLLLALQPTGD